MSGWMSLLDEVIVSQIWFLYSMHPDNTESDAFYDHNHAFTCCSVNAESWTPESVPVYEKKIFFVLE